MNIASHSLTFNGVGLNSKAERKEARTKRIAERLKQSLKDRIAYYSARGEANTIGRMSRFFHKKSEAGILAAFSGDSALTLMALSDALDWKFAKKALDFISAHIPSPLPLGQNTHSPVVATTPIIEISPLNREFITSVQYASEALALKVNEHIKAAKFTSHVTAEKIVDSSFVGPQQPEMHSLTGEFLTGTLSEQSFKKQAAETLLEYQGIVAYSDPKAPKEIKYAISPEALTKVRTAFEDSSEYKINEASSPTDSPIITFKEVAEAYSFKEPLDKPHPVLKPILAFMPPAPAPAPII